MVENWQDPSRFDFDKETIQNKRRELNISKDQTVIVFIANLGLERQLQSLIEAVSQDPKLLLIIGGSGPARTMVKKAAKRYHNIKYRYSRANPGS